MTMALVGSAPSAQGGFENVLQPHFFTTGFLPSPTTAMQRTLKERCTSDTPSSAQSIASSGSHCSTEANPTDQFEFLKRDEFKSLDEASRVVFAKDFSKLLSAASSIARSVKTVFPKRGSQKNHYAKLVTNICILLVLSKLKGTAAVNKQIKAWKTCKNDCKRKNGDQRDMLSSRENLPLDTILEKLSSVSPNLSFVSAEDKVWKTLCANFCQDSPFFFKLVWKSVVRWTEENADALPGKASASPLLISASAMAHAANLGFGQQRQQQAPAFFKQASFTKPLVASSGFSGDLRNVQHLSLSTYPFQSAKTTTQTPLAMASCPMPNSIAEISQEPFPDKSSLQQHTAPISPLGSMVQPATQPQQVPLDVQACLQEGLNALSQFKLDQAWQNLAQAQNQCASSGTLAESELHARVLLGLASVFSAKGSTAQAVDYAQKAVTMCKNLVSRGACAWDVLAQFLIELGCAHIDAGDHSAALRFLNEALSFTLSEQRQLQQKQPHQRNTAIVDRILASCWHNLGVYSLESGRLSAALNHVEQAVALRTQPGSPKDQQAAQSVAGCADCYLGMGSYEKAIATYSEALSIIEAAFGAKHPLTAQLQVKLCSAYTHANCIPEASKYGDKGITALASALPADHHLLSWARLKHSLAQVRGGADPAAASGICRGAIESLRTRLGDEHPRVAEARCDLAELLEFIGDAAGAKGCCDAVLANKSLSNGAHPLFIRALLRRGKLSVVQGSLSSACDDFEAGLTRLDKSFAVGFQIQSGASPSQARCNETIALLDALSHTCLERKMYSSALTYALRLDSLIVQMHGNQSPLLAMVRHGLGTLSFHVQDFDSSEKYFQSVLDFARSAPQIDRRTVPRTQMCLASVYSAQGKEQAAKEMLAKAAAADEMNITAQCPLVSAALARLKGTNEPVNVTQCQAIVSEIGSAGIKSGVEADLLHLGHVYSTSGKMRQALAAVTLSYAIQKPTTGPLSNALIAPLRRIASLCVSQGLLQQADAALAEALQIATIVFAAPHTEIALILSDIGKLRALQAKPKEAQEMLTKALTMLLSILPEVNLDVAAAQYELAGLFLRNGTYEQAVRHYEKALDSRIKLLGEDSVEVIATRYQLANAHVHLDSFDVALDLLDKARASASKRADCTSLVSSCDFGLALLHARQGKLASARDLLAKVAQQKRSLREGLPDLATVTTAQGLLEEQNGGDLSLACNYYKESADVLLKHYGSRHPDYVLSLLSAALAAVSSGALTESEFLVHRALSSTSGSFGVAAKLASVADAYVDADLDEQAVPLYYKALDLAKSSFPADTNCSDGEYESFLEETLEKAEAIAPILTTATVLKRGASSSATETSTKRRRLGAE